MQASGLLLLLLSGRSLYVHLRSREAESLLAHDWLLPAVVHDELARLAPYELPHRREGHVERQDGVVAQDLVLVLGSVSRIAVRSRELAPDGLQRTRVDGGPRRGDARCGCAAQLLELVLHLRW